MEVTVLLFDLVSLMAFAKLFNRTREIWKEERQRVWVRADKGWPLLG